MQGNDLDTPTYAAYHGFRGDIHIDILKCHAEYGTSRVLSQYLRQQDRSCAMVQIELS